MDHHGDANDDDGDGDDHHADANGDVGSQFATNEPDAWKYYLKIYFGATLSIIKHYSGQ